MYKSSKFYNSKTRFYYCSNLTKGYWMRNNPNGGWEWYGNLYNINKIQYSPVREEGKTTTSGDYSVSKLPTLTIVSNVFMMNGTYTWLFPGRVYNNYFLIPLHAHCTWIASNNVWVLHCFFLTSSLSLSAYIVDIVILNHSKNYLKATFSIH